MERQRTFGSLAISSKMLIATIIPLCLFGVLACISFFAIRSLEESARWIEHTQTVLTNASQIERLIDTLENRQRAFLITGAERYLEAFVRSQDELVNTLEQTERLVSDSPKQLQRLNKIRTLWKEWLDDVSNQQINFRESIQGREKDLLYLQKVLRTGKGKAIIDKLIKKLAELESIVIKSGNHQGQKLVASIAKDQVEQEMGKKIIDELKMELNKFSDVEKHIMVDRKKEAHRNSYLSNFLIIGGTLGVSLLSLFFSLLIIRVINRQLKNTARVAEKVAEGNYDVKIKLQNKYDQLGQSLIKMTEALRTKSQELINEQQKLKDQDWLKSNQSTLISEIQGINDVTDFCQQVLNNLVPMVKGHLGLFYLKDQQEDNVTIQLMASYAFSNRHQLSNKLTLGEGLVGQSILEKKKILLLNAPANYLEISSGSGKTMPKNILVQPIIFEENVIAALEIASVCSFHHKEQELIRLAAENLGVMLNNIKSRQETEALLIISQEMAEELQTQQEELRSSNEELEQKTKVLKDSENELKAQSEELQAANEELEEKGEYLERQKNEIEIKNSELESAKESLEHKAKELEKAGKYKSEFLANMSHELRTPLNSLLILSKSLSENDEGNLTDEQISECQIIHNGGKELLTLINDILDLSKVEAGKMDVILDGVSLKRIEEDLKAQFYPIAKQQNLKFMVETDKSLPQVVHLDEQKVLQILKNLLSNSFKFTDSGTIYLKIHPARLPASEHQKETVNQKGIGFSVIDSGIGIPRHQQEAIFNAFQQADGSTSRQYGGTGLGLTISRQLATLMGGFIKLASDLGSGTMFTLILPTEYDLNCYQHSEEELPSEEIQKLSAIVDEELIWIRDDRKEITKDSNVLLIIEDDKNFANILIKEGKAHGFLCIVTNRGSQGLSLAIKYQPIAIILDLGLPDMPGGQILSALKEHLGTRHIPVHIVSARERDATVLEAGAIGYLQKPVKQEELRSVFSNIEKILQKNIKKLLIVEDDRSSQKAMQELIKNDFIDILVVDNGQDAKRQIQKGDLDCIVLDLKLPGMSGIDLLKSLSKEKIQIPPVIVYTGRALTDGEYSLLRKFTSSIVIKGADSPERLFDEVSLFLHSVDSNLPKEQKKIIEELHTPEKVLQGKQVLIVDDDMRNLFALSKILKKYGLKVEVAKDGKFALQVLAKQEVVDLVIMDIMMPVMDGYTAIAMIREQSQFKDLPIIALTAKAMPEDRQKCIDVGASDYLSKPVDVHKLLSLMRVWLGKS